MTTKRCIKLFKQFEKELEQCFKIDKEGEQVLASLVNVAQRLPLLSSSSNEEVEEEKNNKINTSIQNLGILTQCHGIGQLLIQKHFLSLEKSMAFFHDIMKDYQEVIHRMQVIVEEYFHTFKMEANEDLRLLCNFQEWMENVLIMYEAELRRKKQLTQTIEYHDLEQLKNILQQWQALGPFGQVNKSYVQLGLANTPPIQVINDDDDDQRSSSTSDKSKKKSQNQKSKSKKNKKNK